MDLFTLFGTIAINADAAHKTIDSTTGKASGLASTFDKVGTSAASLGKTIAKWLAVGAGGAFLKSSIGAYADYEQLVGGVETLFQNSSSEVMKYASNAFQTAGMSANKYMETVTSFSATLVKGLGGDTAKAAEVADMAVTDMADNANKMGTPIESIQNAYQGFAKQNYTMLDNLKLGYGGTASEMARLINDSGVMGKRFKATAKNLKNIPFDKQIEAIHEMQKQMGIAGTTAEEASGTIAGSWLALGASWENLLAGLSDGNADIDALMDNLFTSVENVAKNIGKVAPSLMKNLGDMIINVAKYAGQKIEDAWENTIYPFIQDQFKIAFGIDLPDWESIKSTITAKWAEVKTAFSEDGLIKSFGITLPDWENLKSEAATKLQEVATTIATNIEPALTKVSGVFESVSGKISDFIGWISGTSESATNFKAALIGVSTALLVFSAAMSIKGLIDGVTSAISAAKAAFALFNATLFANPIILVIAAIAGLVAALTYLYNKNENVRAAIDTAWNAIKTTFETVCTAINAAIQAVTDAWNQLMELLGMGNETGVHTSTDGVNHGGGAGKSFGENPKEVPLVAAEGSESEIQSEVDSYDLEGEALLKADPMSAGVLQSYLDSKDFKVDVKINYIDPGIPHANGLDRVPFDGYRAVLHKDEAVLTAAEAAVWRKGQRGYTSLPEGKTAKASTDQPITVNLTVNGVSSNPYEIAGEVRNALELLRWQS